MVICAKMKTPVKRRFLLKALICLTAMFVPAVGQATHETTEPSDGTVASFRMFDPPREPPYFQFFDAGGQTLTLADFRGKVLLLNLWATWCAPCIREMPALDRLQATVGKEDFLVLPISLDSEGRPIVEAFYQRLGLQHLDMYLDPGRSIGAAFPIDVLPANFLVDREGRVTGYLRSYADWEAPEAEAMIRRLISVPRETE
jgi:thiol-disulfide isomerase/thioredoxin